MKAYQTSLFIFRRDLRVVDNSALNAALSLSNQVITAFIFDPLQITQHAYQSQPGLQFMLESLADLQQQLADQHGQLQLFNESPSQVIIQLKKSQQLEAVFVNRDYTPFSVERDLNLKKLCDSLGIAFNSYADIMLNEPEQVLSNSNTPYHIFTAYYHKARQLPIDIPKPLATGQFITSDLTSQNGLLAQFSQRHNNAFNGGRKLAMTILNSQLSNKGDYHQQRDFPCLAATTGLSAYLKFGCCSIREVYLAINMYLPSDHPLLRQLYWRDFFTQIAFHYPRVFGHAFQPRFEQIPWTNQQDQFWQWANGLTGFPIVDAATRELQQTGWMHNRLRMICASFLVKDLHISWRWGERYFAQHLIDYDPSVNNGNWQWAASTGCDAQPFFRIFNPWLQQQKFDSDCLYIKQWLPELAHLPSKIIHKWQEQTLSSNYPKPMVDHQLQSQISKTLFRKFSNPLKEDVR